MAAKKIGLTVLLVIGVVILVLSLIADLVGLGGTPGFGPRHIIGTIVGAIMVIVGLVLLRFFQPDKSE